jgi:hypothetical protein
MTEPVIPAAYAVLWYVIPILHVGVLVAAIVTPVKARYLTSVERVVWTIISVAIPVAGPFLWLVTYLTDGRRRKSTQILGSG